MSYSSLHHCPKSHNFNSKSLSFHAVSFGPDAESGALRRMVEIARQVQATVLADPSSPTVESSYAEALHTVSFHKPS